MMSSLLEHFFSPSHPSPARKQRAQFFFKKCQCFIKERRGRDGVQEWRRRRRLVVVFVPAFDVTETNSFVDSSPLFRSSPWVMTEC